MDQYLEKLKNKQNLSFDESKSAFEILMTGEASEDQIYDFLTLLSSKGEVSDEIAGGVYVLREKSKISCSFTLPSINNLNASLLSSKDKSSLFFIFSIKCFMNFLNQ